ERGEQDAGRRGMKRHLRLLQPDEQRRGTACTCRRSLEHRQQNAKTTEGAVGHGARKEAPRVLLAPYALPELDRFLRAQGLGYYLGYPRNYPRKMRLNSFMRIRRKLLKHTCSVAAIAPQNVAW